MVHYLDTSALVKLVVAEPESAALREWLTEPDRILVTSDLSRTELLRVVRHSDPLRAPQARNVLDSVTLIAVTPTVFEAAGRLEPTDLRSLDAVHLAAALTLGDEIETMVTYDDRLSFAARSNGLAVVSPR